MSLLIVLHLVRMRHVQKAMPYINLQNCFPHLRSNECPTLRIKTINVLLRRVRGVLQLQVLMVTLIRLSMTRAYISKGQFNHFLHSGISCHANNAQTMRHATNSFCGLSAISNIRIRALMIRVPNRITHRTLTIRRRRRITNIRPLRKSFISRTRLLSVRAKDFLLRYLLRITMSNFSRLLTTRSLHHGKQRLSKSHYAQANSSCLIRSRVVLFRVSNLLNFNHFCLSYYQGGASVKCFMVVHFLKKSFRFHRPIRVHSTPLRILRHFIVNVSRDNHSSQLFHPFLRGFRLCFALYLNVRAYRWSAGWSNYCSFRLSVVGAYCSARGEKGTIYLAIFPSFLRSGNRTLPYSFLTSSGSFSC